MSDDAQSSSPAPLRGSGLGNVPVLAILAAAALAGVATLDQEKPAPALPPALVAPPVLKSASAPAAAVGDPVSLPEPASANAQPTPPPTPEAAGDTPPPVTVEEILPGLHAELAAIRCADLHAEPVDGAIRVSGTVISADDADRVQRLLDDMPAGPARTVSVTVASPALCEPLRLLEPLRAANAGRASPLTVATADGNRALTGGQDLVLAIQAGDAGGPVQVDYFTVDGTVVHLLPNPVEPAPRLDAGSTRRLGERDGRARFWTIGPPFGPELIVVIAGGAPLFAAPRPEAESADTYLPELQRALADADGAVATSLFITTRAP